MQKFTAKARKVKTTFAPFEFFDTFTCYLTVNLYTSSENTLLFKCQKIIWEEELWKFLLSNKHQCQCWKVLKSAPCPNTSQHILYISFLRQRWFSVLLCYLSCAWGWERHRALTLGRHLCAVDHDSVRVWLCASLQSKPYLSPLPVSRLLEGAPDPPTKALQEGCSGCGDSRQLCDGRRHHKRTFWL